MRLPLSWLADHVAHGLGADDLAERLTRSGTKVEAVVLRGAPGGNGNLGAFRVGVVVSAEPHPGADRLRLCRVDVGEEGPRQIVCGAPNVAAGQTVAVALPGAVLPGGRPPLGVATLRGVESHGMILSETELELGADGAGIMVLPEGPAPGAPLAEVLPVSDAVLDCEITSNRPDCLSIVGLAREVSAITGAPLRLPSEEEPPATGEGAVGDYVALRVEAPDLAPRYMARILSDVTVGPSPLWLRARLEAAGMRAINNVVDVTNYVMLLVGQPLHAFDLDRLAGPEIVVRRARQGERIVTLDGVERVMDPSMLAICDAERPAVVAGIFGAEFAEVRPETTRVLLEAATFDGPSVIGTSLRLGLRTESSSRFEKGLPPELAARGMVIATRLLTELAGALPVPGTLDALEPIPARRPVAMRHARARLVLGVEVPEDEAAAILGRLGFGVRQVPGGLEADVPFERARDVTREADLIEEVGRIHGLEGVPAELPRLRAHARRTPRQEGVARLRGLAADLGFTEAVTLKMVPEADLDRLRIPAGDPRRELVRLANPMSEETAVMRPALLPGLLRAAAHNQAHQRASGRLFEVGATFAPAPDGLAVETERLAALLFGPPSAPGWRSPPAAVDLYAATGLGEALGRGVRARVAAAPGARRPYGHPARQAVLRAGGAAVGWAGELHPLVLRDFDVRGPAAAVVLDVGALLSAGTGTPAFTDLISVPVSARDLAVVVDAGVDAADLAGAALAGGAPLVREAVVFDRYEGDPVPAGRVSLALRLTIADPGRTLTDEEIEGAAAAALAAVRDRFGAELRA